MQLGVLSLQATLQHEPASYDLQAAEKESVILKQHFGSSLTSSNASTRAEELIPEACYFGLFTECYIIRHVK